MITYISLKNILTKIPSALIDESDEIEFLDWFMDALKQLPQVIQYQPKIEIFEIVSGKVILPKYIKQINNIYYQFCEPTKSECLELIPEAADLNPNVCKPTITYQMFLDSPFYKNNFTLLKYIGQDKSLLSTNCPNLGCASTETFVITAEKVMYLSLQSGWLCINYDAPVCNEYGELLIPDNQNIIEFLVNYAIFKHWENRKFLKEEQANNFSQEYLQRAEIALRKARGDHFLKNINIQNVADIQSNLGKLISLPQIYLHG